MIFNKNTKIPVKYKTRDGSIAEIIKIHDDVYKFMLCKLGDYVFGYSLDGNIQDNSIDNDLKKWNLVELWDEQFREIN